jgi:hypothetical protein
MNRAERLDCYSKFRVALALDQNLDSGLRASTQRRVDSLAVNPLETSPQSEMPAALQGYDLLQAAAASEDSPFEPAPRKRSMQRVGALRFEQNGASPGWLGVYTRRAKNSQDVLARLDRRRRAEYYLNLLDTISAAGTQPEVAYDSSRIKTAVTQLSGLLPEIKAHGMREHAERTIEKLRGLSQDFEVKAECLAALDSMRQNGQTTTASVAAAGFEASGESSLLP